MASAVVHENLGKIGEKTVKIPPILAILLLLMGCDELRQVAISDKSGPSHFLCVDEDERVSFVLTFDTQRGWYLNGYLKDAVSEHLELSMENLTPGDFDTNYQSSSPSDVTVKISLTVNLVTGKFRAWAYPKNRLPDFTDGQCASVNAVFDID